MWSRISALIFSPVVHAEAQSAYDFYVNNVKGESVHLKQYTDSPVWLVVNVASACGYTDQNYKELQVTQKEAFFHRIYRIHRIPDSVYKIS